MSEGFPHRVRNIIHSRSEYAGVPTCEINVQCVLAPAVQIHHRRPRGMGGSKRVETNSASNGLDACERCHTWVESHRDSAYLNGWLVRHHHQPIYVGVLIRGGWVFLDDDGQKLAHINDPIQPLAPGVTNAS